MHNVIEIKDLSISFKDKKVFENLNITLKNKRFVTILGKSCSGKSSLAKTIVGLIPYNGEIIIDGVTLDDNSRDYLLKKVGIVFENPNQQFLCNTVYEELSFVLENLNYYQIDIDDKIEAVTTLLGIEELLNREIVTLSVGEQQLVALASAIIHQPSLLILDDALSMLDNYYKEIILKTLDILRKKGMTIIYLTSNSIDCIYGTDIVIINNGEIVLNKPLIKALKEEKAFVTSGIEMPFIANISLKLGYYNLVNKIYLDEKGLVDAIWK